MINLDCILTGTRFIVNDYTIVINPVADGYELVVMRGNETQTATIYSLTEAELNQIRDDESARRAAEVAREANESNRVAAEADRVAAEALRAFAESQRFDNEVIRKTEEAARNSAESVRRTNETQRISAEMSRETAESKRAVDTAKAIRDAETAASRLNGARFSISSNMELLLTMEMEG